MALQRNVQQQIARAIEGMLETARWARRTGIPVGAARYLATKGIDIASCAVVAIETASHMLSLENGISAFIVTPENRIHELELELDDSLEQVLQVIVFRDVTEAQNFSKHDRGVAWGWGAVALEVSRRLRET